VGQKKSTDAIISMLYVETGPQLNRIGYTPKKHQKRKKGKEEEKE